VSSTQQNVVEMASEVELGSDKGQESEKCTTEGRGDGGRAVVRKVKYTLKEYFEQGKQSRPLRTLTSTQVNVGITPVPEVTDDLIPVPLSTITPTYETEGLSAQSLTGRVAPQQEPEQIDIEVRSEDLHDFSDIERDDEIADQNNNEMAGDSRQIIVKEHLKSKDSRTLAVRSRILRHRSLPAMSAVRDTILELVTVSGGKRLKTDFIINQLEAIYECRLDKEKSLIRDIREDALDEYDRIRRGIPPPPGPSAELEWPQAPEILRSVDDAGVCQPAEGEHQEKTKDDPVPDASEENKETDK